MTIDIYNGKQGIAFTIASALVCVIGAMIFVITYTRAVNLTVGELEHVFQITIEELDFLLNYRTQHITLAMIILFMAVVVVITDVVQSDARLMGYSAFLCCKLQSIVIEVMILKILLLHILNTIV